MGVPVKPIKEAWGSVTDKATVPIYYESRLAKLELKASERPRIDPEFEEATEGEEVERKEKLKTKWAQLEAVVGSESRLRLIAKDLVQHFESRLAAMDGKAMIVVMSRRIAVALYNEIITLRPDWHSEEDERGALKIVMTGSASDPIEWQNHIRNKPRREELAKRFRDPADPFKIVIVRDMWLTGFDAPSTSIAINATQRAIRARITSCMARPPELAAPRRTNGSIPSIFGGEMGTGMRIVPSEFVTRSGA
jgi:type I restriction enzyme, R subunit